MGKWTHRLHTLWDSLSYDAVLVGVCYAIFATIKNCADWWVSQTYGDPTVFWETYWRMYLAKFESYFGKEDLDYNLLVWGTCFLTFSLYWIGAIIFLFFDITQMPKFLRKYKTQPGEHDPLDLKTAAKVIAVVIFNQLFVQLPLSMAGWPVLQFFGIRFSTDLPSLNQFMVEQIASAFILEFLFYHSHKLFHHRLIYKHVHKIHHEFQAPFAPAAAYCHPLEHLIANMSPIFIGSMLCTRHLITMWLWTVFVTIATLFDHSGYHLPFSFSPQHHDYHHLKFNECYGGKFAVLDALHGTADNFHDSVYYKRHKILLGFKSINEEFPDTKQKQKSKKNR